TVVYQLCSRLVDCQGHASVGTVEAASILYGAGFELNWSAFCFNPSFRFIPLPDLSPLSLDP
ncbi:MAG: hypothetical protein Q8P67_16300, partial [archaeon]|nr:hypothetical protein [archaeon]